MAQTCAISLDLKTIFGWMLAIPVALAAPSSAKAFFSEGFGTDASVEFYSDAAYSGDGWGEQTFGSGSADWDVTGAELRASDVDNNDSGFSVDRLINVPASVVSSNTPITVSFDMDGPGPAEGCCTSGDTNWGAGVIISGMVTRGGKENPNFGTRTWPGWGGLADGVASPLLVSGAGVTPTGPDPFHVDITITPNCGSCAADQDEVSMVVQQAGNTYDAIVFQTVNTTDFEYSGNQLRVGFFRESGMLPIITTYDNLSVNTPAAPGPAATTFTWNQDGLGDWAVQGNWTFTGTAPSVPRANNPNHTAIFGDLISGLTNVSTNAAVTVNRIEFNNAANNYIVSGGGSVNLMATTSPSPVDPSLAVGAGTHQFQAIVNLLGTSTADIASGSELTFNNALNLSGNTLTKTGAGTLTLNNDLNTGGGEFNIQQGTVAGGGTVGGDVVNGGGTISPGNSSSANSVIPEPAAGVLLLAGILGVLLASRRRE